MNILNWPAMSPDLNPTGRYCTGFARSNRVSIMVTRTVDIVVT